MDQQGLNIQTKELRNKADSILNEVRVVSNILDTITSNVNRVRNSWQSEAQEEFLKQYNNLSKNFPGFKSAVDDFGKKLIEVAEIYEKSDKNVSAAAQDFLN